MATAGLSRFKPADEQPLAIKNLKTLIDDTRMKNRNYRQDAPASGPAFTKPGRNAFANDAEAARWVILTVKELDSGGNPGSWNGNLASLEMKLACFMVGSSVTGADEQRIAAMLGLDTKLAEEWAKNLRKNGLWLHDGTAINDTWFDQDGKVGFTMDSLVAKGLVERIINPGTEPVYQTVPGRHIGEIN